MKRLKSALILLFALVIGLLTGLRLFMPWEKITETAFLKATANVPAEAISYFVEGIVPALGVRGLELKAPMGSIVLESLKGTPLLTRSLLSMAPTVRLDLERAVAQFGGTSTSFRGEIILSLKGGEVSVKDLNLQGGLEIQGNMDLSLETSRIIRADVTIKAPKELGGILSAASAMMPLTQGPEGIWNLKRERGQ